MQLYLLTFLQTIKGYLCPQVAVIQVAFACGLAFWPTTFFPRHTPTTFNLMENGMQFYTATCLNWQPLLQSDKAKMVIMDSLKFLVEDGRIHLYGFVVMHNHIHLLWCRQLAWLEKNVQRRFMTHTAQMLKFDLLENDPDKLKLYKSTQVDREYQLWERRPYKATMYNRVVAEQKLDYIHNNPVKAELCKYPEDYLFSSAAYYKTNDETTWPFLTHYAEHI